MQGLRELASDRAIVGRVACGVVGTVAVLVASPPAWVLLIASGALVPVAAVECSAARRRVGVPARSSAAGSGRSALQRPVVGQRS